MSSAPTWTSFPRSFQSPSYAPVPRGNKDPPRSALKKSTEELFRRHGSEARHVAEAVQSLACQGSWGFVSQGRLLSPWHSGWMFMDVELYRAPIMQVGLIMLEFWGGVAIASWSVVFIVLAHGFCFQSRAKI